MSLLDSIMTASGAPTANYLRGGRHVVRIHRIVLTTPDEDRSLTRPRFQVDGELLFSDRPTFSDVNVTMDGDRPANKKGMIVRVNDPFKFVDTSLARVRRFLAVSKGAKSGAEITESTLGLTKNDKETDAEFSARILVEAKRLLGADQPCKGAVIAIIGTESKNQKTGTPYTLFEPAFPNRDDLVSAGVIPAIKAA